MTPVGELYVKLSLYIPIDDAVMHFCIISSIIIRSLHHSHLRVHGYVFRNLNYISLLTELRVVIILILYKNVHCGCGCTWSGLSALVVSFNKKPILGFWLLCLVWLWFWPTHSLDQFQSKCHLIIIHNLINHIGIRRRVSISSPNSHLPQSLLNIFSNTNPILILFKTGAWSLVSLTVIVRYAIADRLGVPLSVAVTLNTWVFLTSLSRGCRVVIPPVSGLIWING